MAEQEKKNVVLEVQDVKISLASVFTIGANKQRSTDAVGSPDRKEKDNG